MTDDSGHARAEGALHRVYLGLGSNLGDRDANLRAALTALAPAVRVSRLSSVYETAPMHLLEQPDFHNLVCEGETALAPQELLRTLKAIERALGRTPGPRYGPRLIDIDILLYDDLTLETPDLCIPHPRMVERAFVLVPLVEIAPHLWHPVLGTEIATLAERMAAGGGIRCIGPLFDTPA